MRQGRVDHAVVVNAFSIDEWRGREWAPADGDAERDTDDGLGPLAAGLVRFNEWLVSTVARLPKITPFVAIDPWLLSPAQIGAHLDQMRGRGARGVKIHPVEQRFAAADPRLFPVYRACAELDLTVLAHSGPTRDGRELAGPPAFAAVAASVPELRLIVGHLGGGDWRLAAELAAAHPRVLFDLSEIIAWTGAPHAPSAAELVRLVRQIGVDRVLFGSDFPWYDPGEMADRVRRLPGLATAECAAILGENAARALSLPV
jgi:predicted TIM-barrel fold metal-dependent hydrolase